MSRTQKLTGNLRSIPFRFLLYFLTWLLRNATSHEKSQPIAVLIMRGGLGNQMFQTSALAKLAHHKPIMPCICDYYVKVSSNAVRDGKEGQYKFLPIRLLFEGSASAPLVLEGFREILVVLIWRLSEKTNSSIILRESEVFKMTQLPKFFFMVGSFQNKIYPLGIPENNMRIFAKTVRAKAANLQYNNRVLIHIRLTDFAPSLFRDDNNALSKLTNYYVKFLGEYKCRTWWADRSSDCYSDDLETAKKILHAVGVRQVTFPEDRQSLKSLDLLYSMIGYRYVIASNSSLCWWACFLTWLTSEINILCDWSIEHDFLRTDKQVTN